jgi:hypothetical protein
MHHHISALQATMLNPAFLLLGLAGFTLHAVDARYCRNVPGRPNYPTDAQWQALGESVSGRLVRAIPSGEFCRQTNCTDAEWASANWRNTVPGAMNVVSGTAYSLRGRNF